MLYSNPIGTYGAQGKAQIVYLVLTDEGRPVSSEKGGIQFHLYHHSNLRADQRKFDREQTTAAPKAWTCTDGVPTAQALKALGGRIEALGGRMASPEEAETMVSRAEARAETRQNQASLREEAVQSRIDAAVEAAGPVANPAAEAEMALLRETLATTQAALAAFVRRDEEAALEVAIQARIDAAVTAALAAKVETEEVEANVIESLMTRLAALEGSEVGS